MRKKMITGILAAGMAFTMAFPALAAARPCDAYETCGVEGCDDANCHEHEGVWYRGTRGEELCDYHREACEKEGRCEESRRGTSSCGGSRYENGHHGESHRGNGHHGSGHHGRR